MNKQEMHAWIDSCQEETGFVPVNSHRRKKQRKASGEGDKMIRVPKSCANGFMDMLALIQARLGTHSREVQLDFVASLVRHHLEGEARFRLDNLK